MKAKELIEKLQELSPDEEIYIDDSEYGAEKITELVSTDLNHADPVPNVWCVRS